VAEAVITKVTFLNPDTQRTVVCDTCCMPVAEDNGGRISGLAVRMAIENHLNHPRDELTSGLEHSFGTYNNRTHRMTWEIVLKVDYIL
jgi:hypothetical protein